MKKGRLLSAAPLSPRGCRVCETLNTLCLPGSGAGPFLRDDTGKPCDPGEELTEHI